MNILLVLVILGLGILIVLQLRKRDDSGHHHVSERIEDLNQKMVETMLKMQSQMEERLKATTEQGDRSTKHLGDRMDMAAKAVKEVMIKMTEVEAGNKRIYDVGKDIASLQEILKAPKLRGNLGELFLGDLLSQILPPEHFALQHHFKDGLTVDAVIVLKDGVLVPVDSKFPLENFMVMLAEEKEGHEEGAQRAKKLFANQVKKHIDDIAEKYIRPDEHTLDFALMYIPAENVYYETIIKGTEDLVGYAHKKKVFPVSPNSFYIYLQAILMGLRGLQIEKETKNIIAGLGRIHKEFEKFTEDYRLVGKHISNAHGAYEDGEKRMEKFSDRVGKLLDSSDESLVDGQIKTE